MSTVNEITVTSVSTVNQITITDVSGISIATVGTQGLAGPSTIMGKEVDGTNTAGANDNGAVLIYNNATSTWTASTLNTSQSITQNIYNLRLNGANVTVNSILDEDNMNSNSATALATQQSIKKYVDDNNTVQDLDIVDDSGNQIDVRINDETLGLLGGTGISSVANGTAVTFNIDATVVTLSGTQTLTNKTLTSPALTTPVFNTSISGSAFLDEDNFASNSANKVASQQSIKAYVDTKLTAEDLDVTDGTSSGAIDLDSEVLGLLGGTGLTSALSGNNFTFAIDNSVATISGTQTLTNKTLTQPKLNGSTAITTTGTELNILDGNTGGSSVVIVDADRFIINDNGVMKQIAVTRLDTYFSGTTATLTNKTLTAPVVNNGVLNTGLSGSAFLDEDNLSSNSATKVASQQSIKAYVDANITAQDLDVTDGSTNIAIDLDSETLSLLGGTGIDSTASGNGVTFAIDNTVATLVGTQTLTNKTINVDNNTLSNIELDNLKSGVLDTNLSSVASTDTTIASAKAIKTYVDANITAQDLDITDGSATIAIDLDSETLSLLGGTGVTSTASGNGVTLAIGQSVATGDNVVFNQVTAALVGNSSTATALQNARTIGGVSFNGTSNINLAGVNTAGNQNTSGNSATTTALATARTIGGTSFNGTANIAVGLSATATALATARTIALSGDVTASGVSFDGTGNITLSTTIAANSVALGTDTTGNYVAGITGSSNEIEVTNSGGENRTVNIGLPDNVIISGNLTVNGTTTTTDTNELHVTDPLIKLAKDNTSNSLDIGFYGQYRASGSANQYAGLFRDQNDSGKFKLFQLLQNEPTTTVNTSGTGYAVATLVATIEGNVTGNVTGNTSGTSATVTGAAQTAITSVGTLTALQVDNININGNTISSTAGTHLNIVPLSGQKIVLDNAIVIDAGVVTGGTSITSTDFVGDLTGDVTGNASGNAGTATVLATARTIGGTSFNGSANIEVGLANTSTVLATSRNFSVSGDITASAVAFNGSSNVVLSATIDDNVVGAAQLNISGNGSVGQAILSDGDGSFSYGDASKTTEQIQDIVGGMVTSNTETGITVTYEDGDGTLDFVINPAQTTITSLLATDIKIGEDDQTKIDFETADEIHFYVANAQQIKFIDGAIVPVTNNDIDLGTSSLEFKNAFFDGTVTSDAFAGALTGNVTGNISGNSGTATLLQTARTIGGTSFNGSANIAIALANTATTLATARTIGGVSFNGSANINLAGVNTSGNQDTSGNSATTTALATSRTIGGTAFNGTANIAIALANTATTLATARTINGVSFNGSANITTLTAGTGVSVSGTAVSIGQAVATSNSPTFANLTLGGTDSIKVPSGSTAQRNGSPANGMFRYNNSNEEFEGYQNGAWGAIAGGGASAMETNNFTGNGSTRAYSLSSNVVDEDNLIIFIDGVYQNKGDYVASGNTLTFDTAPVNGRDIVIHHMRTAIAGSSMVSNNFTGNGSATAFTLSISPTSELNTQVYVDGVYQNKTTYAVSGTTLTFDTAPVSTTAIEVIMMSQTSINVPASDSVTTSMIKDANITTAKILNSNITLAKMAANSVDSNQYVDGSIDLVHMSANSVDSDQYVDGSIDTVHIADSQITSAKIANGTIATADIADSAITSAKIANGTIVTADLANDSVDGSKLTNNIDIAGTLDVTGATTLDSTLSVSGAITGTLATAAQPNITSVGTLSTLRVDDITINGSTISDGGDLTVDVAGSIILDADGGDVQFKDGGTSIGAIINNNSDFVFRSLVSDKDVLIKGLDGSSIITALTLDMSAAGAATFNSGAIFGGGITVAGIGGLSNIANDLTIFSSSSGHNGLRFHVNGILPTNNAGAIVDADADLGISSHRFKDLYLSGQALITGGAVSAPSYSFIGDTDTGISRPTTNALNFVTAGSERVRVDANGKIHINESVGRAQLNLSLGNVTGVGQFASSQLNLSNPTNVNSISQITFGYDATGRDNAAAYMGYLSTVATTNGKGALVFGTRDDGNDTQPTERMRVTSAGNVGIGTSSPAYITEIAKSQAGGVGATLYLHNTADNSGVGHAAEIRFNLRNAEATTRNAAIQAIAEGTYGTSPALTFLTSSGDNGSATERVRITSAGFLGIGLTNPARALSTKSSSVTVGTFESTSASGSLISFVDPNTTNDVTVRVGSQANALVLQTGGVERVRVLANGKMGIGTASPATLLHIKAASGEAELRLEAANNSEARLRFGDATDNDAAYVGYSRSGGLMNFSALNTAGSQMTLASSGDLTVGTSSLGFHFDVSTQLFSTKFGNSGNLTLAVNNSSGSGVGGEIFLGGSTRGDSLRNCISFRRASGTQSMVINAAGSLLVGEGINNYTTHNGMVAVVANASNPFPFSAKAMSTSQGFMGFYNAGNTLVGSIFHTNGGTSFNTSSDYRLKENVDYEFTALDRVAQLKPARFNFIADADNTVDGFIAHEVQEIVPEAITGEKDAMQDEEYEVTPAVLDDDGSVVTEAEMGTRKVPDYQGIDQSKLVPLLTKAIQEQQTLIDSLLARVEQLEN